MFFPCLENLKKARFPERSIEILDWWLGTRRPNTRQSLNPLQFCLDCNIDVEHALKLFAYCVYDDNIKILRQKFAVYCPSCGSRIKIFYDNINKRTYSCNNCGYNLSEDLLDDSTVVTYVLMKDPVQSNAPLPPMGVGQGKAESLRISTLREHLSHDEELRGLLSFL